MKFKVGDRVTVKSGTNVISSGSRGKVTAIGVSKTWPYAVEEVDSGKTEIFVESELELVDVDHEVKATYRNVPVPTELLPNMDRPEFANWKRGVDAALKYRDEAPF